MDKADTSPIAIPTEDDIETLQRAEGLWFEDGSLIIRAENTIFRVSRDILSARSSVFRDMLALPQPPLPNGVDTMDGCPLVHLPDGAKDMQYFLQALFDYQFFNPYPAPTIFPIVSGVLRMSHKYDVEGLRRRALMHLSAGVPVTLQEAQSNCSGKRSTYLVAVIQLARQVSADWIIPWTVYRLCGSMTAEEILRGVDVNGTTVKLDFRDQVVAMEASTFLRGNAISKVLRFLYSPLEIDGCRRPNSCIHLRLVAYSIAENWGCYIMPLTVWLSSYFTQELKGVCSVCLSAMKSAHSNALNELWDELPGICGLSGWKDLVKMRDEALA
ncbi:hypothetical protein GGX14DRAFT_600566 [Mycena pura]|uniref:BTB domain-containing protein n=1 Tax=Mycena pura TaxID=153505 RepID=A0AAD6Y0T2_9AGAR|nr:hypothetical protein GGX14DRAFT_600566 [Mycena pura]